MFWVREQFIPGMENSMCKDPEVGDQGFFLLLSCMIGTKTLLWTLHNTPGSSNCPLIDIGAQNIKA